MSSPMTINNKRDFMKGGAFAGNNWTIEMQRLE